MSLLINASKIKFGLIAILLIAVCCLPRNVQADVIDVDRRGVSPEFAEAFINAEAIWESRIQNYSTDLPRALLAQLSSIQIIASTPPLGAGILGRAGPRATVSYQSGDPFNPRIRVVPVVSVLEINSDEIPFMIANGILESVIFHEMGHAMGFGSVWDLNGLTEPIGGVGLTQYTGGTYAIRGYGIDIGSPLTTFVPLEQRGGGGTALSHWIDAPPFFNQVFTAAFTKEVMTGFACDADPATGATVCASTFVSNATWGAMADLGYEVAGVNDNANDPPAGLGTGRWPKVTGSGFDPFRDNGVPAEAGVSFNLVNITVRMRKSLGEGGGDDPGDVGQNDPRDPYNLRRQRWVK